AAQLWDDMQAERARMFKRYVASKRHTMQVDFDNYLHELRREQREGARRVREHGFRVPVPARARCLERAAAARPAAEAGRGARTGGGRVRATATGKRAQTKDRNRQALLDAAREVFTEMGFGAASIRDIVRRTDLASGTFYNYFPDKETIFGAVLEERTTVL